MAGGQAIEGEGVKRGVIFHVPAEALTYDVAEGHPLHETDRARVEVIDEELVLSIMALGVKSAVQVTVEESSNGKKRYLVVDGRRRVFNTLEANKRLKKRNEPLALVPVLVAKGDEDKLAEIMVALNELSKAHSIMAKAKKAALMLERVKDTAPVARAFGVTPSTIAIWVELDGMSAFAKRLVDDGRLTPSAAVKFAKLSPADQKTEIEKFLATAESQGVKPTARFAGETAKARRTGAVESTTPSRRLLKAIIDRKDLRDQVDPVVVKVVKWICGEGSPNGLAGLAGVITAVEKERKDKIDAKSKRAEKKAAKKEKKAAKITNGAAKSAEATN